MKSKLLTSVLTFALTSGVLASMPAVAQDKNEMDTRIRFELDFKGRPIDDCSLGHAACCNLAEPLWALQQRSTTAREAVETAKKGDCGQAVAMILATQCHNPEALRMVVNNPNAVCSELAK